uniref:DZF domain-containing protein n=1 Tax=Elaeophora elaphi TaxID=1147741 RepID=A0A0R3RFT5_9BILA
MAILDDRDHVANQVKMAKMVRRDMMVQMEIREKRVPMDQKVAVIIVHLPELLQAIKQLWWIIEKSDLKLSFIAIISIQCFDHFCIHFNFL